MRKGHCLNSLGSGQFDLRDVANSESMEVPKAVKRVHEIFEKPTFMKNVSGADVKQGHSGDCWLMAGLSSLANVEGGLQRICVEYDTRKSNKLIRLGWRLRLRLTDKYDRRRDLRIRILP